MEFLSNDWFDEHEKLVQEAFSKETSLNTELCEVYEHYQGSNTIWCYYKMVNGIFTEIKHGEGTGDIPDALFRVFGETDSYIKVIKGELDPNKGLMNGTFKLEGNMMKAIGLLGTYKKLTECKIIPGVEL